MDVLCAVIPTTADFDTRPHDVRQQLSSCSSSLKPPRTHKTLVFHQVSPLFLC